MNRSTGLKTFLMVMCLSTAVVPSARAGVNLDGVNDRLDIADHENFTHNPSNSYSWSFWVCPRNVNDDWKAAYCALIDINTVVGIYVGNASGIGPMRGLPAICRLAVGMPSTTAGVRTQTSCQITPGIMSRWCGTRTLRSATSGAYMSMEPMSPKRTLTTAAPRLQ